MRDLVEDEGHVYTPCPKPLGPVDYVFLCMEPSLDGNSPEKAKAKLDEGYRNFLPGGMKVKDAPAERKRRWDSWYPLLLEELNLLARSGLRVFAVGRQIEKYLESKDDFPWRPVHPVVHYSPLAAAWARGNQGHEVLVREASLARLGRYSSVSESNQKLIFNYKLAFEPRPRHILI